MALDWEERYSYARDLMLPWVEGVVPLAGRRVIEFGCGNGPVTCALAERGATVLALDIDERAVDEARGRIAAQCLEAEFSSAPFARLLEEVETRGPVDVFFLFATLEHMTIDERLKTLAAARDAIGRDGFLVVCETPNRLLPSDDHTSLLPFFGMLPDELALRFVDRSEREEFRADVASAIAEGEAVARERLARWGRGASFHEFELAFPDFPANVVACNYEPNLLGIRPPRAEELALARSLKRLKPDIPPSFTRYWIDVVIAGDLEHPRRFFEPWPFETTQSTNVDLTDSDGLLFRHPGARLRARLGHATQGVVVGFHHHAEPVELHVHVDGEASVVVPIERAPAGSTAFTTVRLSCATEALTLELSGRTILNFLAFERLER
jgi:SAM-dependent methyltransferase